ncbi:HesA/MoeB/ThiF family protein [Xenorhabdus bovienii]|nr:ThiF family adenylyltransferase [Xenorhabdus bovienii]CDG87532.1 Dinucleotide-utilizing enzyme possibly involved in molybdopterin or thiamin biosynthesis [Xenorhabdus bovienii str. feltiae France]CDG94129.1 Dinucleotide-utilizing enzyme possibly involved in molybdopterin or thiamin biosynthesis [Xenorhabdus bovienii str. feltiae Florida]
MEKVKLKSTVLIYSINKKSVTLRYCSEIINIDDSLGDIAFFFGLLNGLYNESEIIEEFSKKYNSEYSQKAVEYLETVKDLGLVELVNVDNQNVLDDYEIKRWSRNIEFFNVIIPFGYNKYEVQSKICNSRVALIGCGGLGSHILLELAALGIKNLVIADFDEIELSNLNRQILYKEDDIGKKKVFTAKERVLEFSSRMNITALDKKISSKDDIKEIVSGVDLVICVADKPRHSMVKWLNSVCCELNIPYINGGLDTKRSNFYSVIPGVSGCTECWFSSLGDSLLQKKVLQEDYLGKDYKMPAPALSALVSITAGIMVCEAIKLLSKSQHAGLTNKRKSFIFDDL